MKVYQIVNQLFLAVRGFRSTIHLFMAHALPFVQSFANPLVMLRLFLLGCSTPECFHQQAFSYYKSFHDDMCAPFYQEGLIIKWHRSLEKFKHAACSECKEEVFSFSYE